MRQLVETRPSALVMSDPGVEPLEIMEILEQETPPYPCPPYPCPHCPCPPCPCPPCPCLPCPCPPCPYRHCPGQVMVGVMSFHKIYDLIG